MSINKLNPYINFNGTAERAIHLYENALGAKVESIMRFGDVPETKAPPEYKNRVLHSALRIGEDTLMLSDMCPGKSATTNGNVNITLDFSDEAEMSRAFAALAEGGKVITPLEDTFWGAKFGVLADAYEVCWMFNCNKRKKDI